MKITFIEYLIEMREPKTCAKRNKKNLPNSWDDKEPTQQHSWKKSHKNQYK